MARQNSSFDEQPFSPGIFVGGLVAAFGLWIITGALAYNDSNYPTANTEDFGFALCITVVPLAFCLIVGNVTPEYERLPSPPRKASMAAITIVLLFCVCSSIAFCIVTAGQRRFQMHVFIILSSTYAGILLEVATGWMTSWLRRLQRAQ